MDETAESHAKNEISEMPIDLAAESLLDESSRACGIPQQNIDKSKEAPYMLKVSDLVPCNPSSYCPIWKDIKDAVNIVGQRPITMSAWLARGKLQIKNWESDKLSATHVTMNNGRFHIPDDKEDEFLRWYALSVSQNLRVWFVEQLTPIMRYFVDLDFAQLVGIPEQTMEAMAKCVQLRVRSFFPDVKDDKDTIITLQKGEHEIDSENEKIKVRGTLTKTSGNSALRAIVCTTNYKFIKAKDGKPEMVKTGVHILWPNIYLTRDDALNIRESILVALELEFGKRVHPLNPWSDVVDSSVYGSGNSGTKGSGLRMIGSRKTDMCDECKGRKKIKSSATNIEKECVKCLGNGRLDTGRPYFPLCVLRSNGTRDHNQEELYRQNMQSLITETKVRTPFLSRPKFPNFVIPNHAPLHMLSTAKKGRITLAEKDATKGILKPKDINLKKSVTLELSNSSKVWDAILTVVCGVANGLYKDVVLSKVTMNSAISQYVVHVNGNMCRYCHNIKREHLSNRIFFVIDASGVAQHCHDSATEQTEEMQYGLCKTYAGLLGRIPQSLVAVLFPSCAAAKTLVSAEKSSIIDDDEDLDAGIRRISDSRKMRRILLIGDALSQELFKVNWSNTLRTSSGGHLISTNHKKKRTTFSGSDRHSDHYALDPAALGARGHVAIRDLGFDDSTRVIEDDTCADARKKVTPLIKLTSLLFRDLDFGVELASNMQPHELPNQMGFDFLLSSRLFQATSQKSLSKKTKSLREVE